MKSNLVKQDIRKTLFVEPTEFGHVMLHLSAFFSSEIWNKENINFLAPKSVKTRVVDENIIDMIDANKIFIDPLVNKNKNAKIFHLLQIFKLQKKNKYTDICFKYLDYHILLVPFLKLFYRKVRISGIFFRPVLHYSKLNYPYSGIPRSYWYFMLIKNFVLFLFLKTGIMTSCFFQDEGAIEIFGGRKKNAFWIPTPLSSDFIMPPSKNSGQIKKFLFFGQISKRKGIYRVLEAWKKLPSIYQDKTYLNIIGRTSSEDVDRVSELIADLKKNGWLINFDNRFVENEEIPKIYEETDIVLSPHDLQFGTSGVTVQSAVWLRPTIVHELGWVGFTVKNKSLGLSIDSANIELFAKIIIEIIDGVIKLNVQEKIAYDLRKINSSNLWAENLYYGIIRGNG